MADKLKRCIVCGVKNGIERPDFAFGDEDDSIPIICYDCYREKKDEWREE